MIKLLPNDLINKIAAGEVVERPASAVKELIENAIDANATEVTLSLTDYGLSEISVLDNGNGMDMYDTKMSFVQHATSKIQDEKDLEAIYTLGFRGEALASISSVADVHIYTYNGKDQPYHGYLSNDGLPNVENSSGQNKGTKIVIKNIFHKVPARRKFLKSPTTEYKYIYDIFESFALSNPDIGFKLIRDNKIIMSLPSNTTLKERIIALNKDISHDNIIEVQFDSPKLKISGFIGHPSISRKLNDKQFLFINGRIIRNQTINKAVQEGYRSTLMTQQYPVFFININIDPTEIDVNIHPRKSEIRFNDSSTVFYAIKTSVEKALTKKIQSNFEHNTNILFNKYETSTYKLNNQNNSSIRNQDSLFTNTKNTYNTIQGSIDFTRDILADKIASPIINDYNHELKFDETLNYYQFFNTYIVFESDDELTFIDQHAADERYNYERVEKIFKTSGKILSIPLLIPLDIYTNDKLVNVLLENISFINSLGFQLSINKNKIKITDVPEILIEEINEQLFQDIVDEINSDKNTSNTIEMKLNNIFAKIACHGSIRAGQKLSIIEMQSLIKNLYKTNLPYSCPHGRPIIWKIKKTDLEKNFKRIV